MDDIDLSFFDDAPPVESQKTVTSRMLKSDLKRQTLKMTKREHLRETMKECPAIGSAYHVISNGQFDFWTWIPHILDLVGTPVEFYGSTWTLNRPNCEEMLALFDAGKLTSIGFLTGTYFKRRESAVYAKLLTGLLDRGQKYVCFENHAKVALLGSPETGNFITIEGSANFTANPRLEQYCIVNDRVVYEFHKEWMEEVLSGRQEAAG